MTKKIVFIAMVTCSLCLSGCAGALLGGGAAAASTLHDRRTTGTIIDDQTIKVNVLKNIKSAKHVSNNSHISVSVYNKIVLLTGEARDDGVIKKARKIAQAVHNVKKVESGLVVAPVSSMLERSNDAAITTKVKTSLLTVSLPNFDPSLIKVTTEKRTVYLMGLVTRVEADAIAVRASKVSGVKSVVKVFEVVKGRFQ